MNLKKAQRTLDRIRNEISVDDSINHDDVMTLLDILEPYTRTYSTRFTRLRNVLVEAMRNGIGEKRQYLVDILNETEEFLIFENKVEKAIGLGIAALFASLVIYVATL